MWLVVNNTTQLKKSIYFCWERLAGIFGDFFLLGNGAFSTCNQLAALQQNKRPLPTVATQCGLVNSSVALFTHQRFEKEENFLATTGMISYKRNAGCMQRRRLSKVPWLCSQVLCMQSLNSHSPDGPFSSKTCLRWGDKKTIFLASLIIISIFPLVKVG